MKLIKKVERVDVKRCFVITYYMRKFGIAGKHDSKLPTRDKYLIALKKSKKAVNTLNEKQLDKIISGHSERRLRSYNNVQWYVGEGLVKEVGVWKKAGGLPAQWMTGSLFDTAKQVKKGLQSESKEIRKRARRAIPAIIHFKTIIKKEQSMLPIVFQNGLGITKRTGLSKQKWDIDDGNMRLISFAVTGDKKFRAYVGVAKK